MAYIDKIYGSSSQWDELFLWLSEFYPDGVSQMYDRPPDIYTIQHLSNFDKKTNRFLWKHCKIKFVRDRLKEQYGPKGPPAVKHTKH